MPDETTSTSTAPIGGSSAPAAGSGSESSPATGGSTSPAATPEPATPTITADTFGWDTWDGSEDALPEDVRPWISKAGGYYTKQSDLARQEAERVKTIYESLMEGREDPRLAEYKTQLEDLGKTRSQLEQERDHWKAQHSSSRQEFEQFVDARATQVAEQFQKQNPWIFESQEIQALGASLMDEKFDMNDLPILLRMPGPLLEATRKIHKDLVSSGAKNVGSHAIKLARAEFRVPESSPAAAVAGANGSTPSTAIPATPGPDMTLGEAKNLAVRRAWRSAKGS